MGGGVAGVAAAAAGQVAAARAAAAGGAGGGNGAPLASAAPGELKSYNKRQVISEFGGDASITVGALLENDSLFSLTQMLGDVPDGAAAAGPPTVGPTNFAGMFGGPLSDALGTLAAKPTGPPTKGPGSRSSGPDAKEKKPRPPPVNKKQAGGSTGAPYVSSLVMPTNTPVPGAMVPGYINPANGSVAVQQQPVGSAASSYPHHAPQGQMAATHARETAAANGALQ